jgi:hypothetical protein
MKLRLRRAVIFAAGLGCAVSMAASASAETKSFVVSWFYPANYYGDDTCPQGLNPLPDVFFKRDLTLLGVPKAEIDDMFDKDYNIQTAQPMRTDWVKKVSTRGNGKDNVYTQPTSIPDRQLHLAQGRFGYGFNLDGKGGASPNSYEDPDTHERGVNNQLFRAIGCIQSYRGGGQRPLTVEYKWSYSRSHMPAWLITITGNDLGHDGDVAVTIENAIDPADTLDANGDVQAGMSYRVDPNPKWGNVVKGVIKDGVIMTEPAAINLLADAYIQPYYDFRGARLRLVIAPDGKMTGVLGAYQAWYPFYWSNAKGGYIDERGFGVDAPALYYALRKSADADPDPVTGENRAISAAYMIEAVPAFALTPEIGKTAEAR